MSKAKSWKSIVTETLFGSGATDGKTVTVICRGKTYKYIVASDVNNMSQLVAADMGFYVISGGGIRFFEDELVPYSDEDYATLLTISSKVPNTIYIKDEATTTYSFILSNQDEDVTAVIRGIPSTVTTFGDIANLADYGLKVGSNNNILTFGDVRVLLENKTTVIKTNTPFTNDSVIYTEE